MGVKYPVLCECGQTQFVSGGLAGSLYACGCGRTVEVPGLSTLRSAAGVPTLGPELVIEALLRDGHVPGMDGCACCGAATAKIHHVAVECERAEVRQKTRNNPLMLVVYGLFGGLIGGLVSLLSGENERREHGRNVAYRLPLRVCEDCRQGRSQSASEAAIRSIDEYRRLLVKYPHARIGRME